MQLRKFQKKSPWDGVLRAYCVVSIAYCVLWIINNQLKVDRIYRDKCGFLMFVIPAQAGIHAFRHFLSLFKKSQFYYQHLAREIRFLCRKQVLWFISWDESRGNRCKGRMLDCVCFGLENWYNVKQQLWASFSTDSGRRQQIWDIDYFVECRLLWVSNLIRTYGVDFK